MISIPDQEDSTPGEYPVISISDQEDSTPVEWPVLSIIDQEDSTPEEQPVPSPPEPKDTPANEVPVLTGAWDLLEPYLEGLQRLERRQPGTLSAIQRTLPHTLPFSATGEYIIPAIPEGEHRSRSKSRRKRALSFASDSPSSDLSLGSKSVF